MEELPNLYDRLGAENLKLLVDYFYDLVFTDERLAPLFSKTPKEVIKNKQLLFLTQFLGGPAAYSELYGHPKMRARHMPHEITENKAIAWLQCMNKAVYQLPIDEQLKKELFSSFPKMAFHMVNREE
ncbi:hemoglobin-like protein [Sporocytophaga myxococcoides]|uniref:Hemoglobin-like protein n=1 Tax=Sporocytophaga myxococcoides TaxID=153721 RepID=A0A098LGF8_9BACT|nr:globin [Sporocytophaga myxococcoides]GAL85544.1 hemoglobin-like protein [Sporocytophaga myxococcoides]